MERNKESIVRIAPAMAAESSTDYSATEAVTVSKTAPADETTSTAKLPIAMPTAPPTAPEAAPSPEQTTTTTRGSPVPELVVMIPGESGPPPQYDEHENDAITTAAPAVALQQTNKKVAPIGPPVPVSQRFIPLAQLGDEPARICCPFCLQKVQTRVNKESTSATSMAAVCCCLFGGICCAFLPFCMEMCHDSHHFCTNCGVEVAIHPHDGPVQQFGPDSPGAITQAPGCIQPPEAVTKN
ncbi:LPS-induced tumor necrosis factor alpha factor [Penicillium digitatum]|uniref:LITAF domain-containing protein n=3 Tax=Penicillium digitatum TaxID=36651 RepID=K9GZ56_PEND2|nr:hypothetical protein PDIP_02710 [Penicillium digitatum Pd1]EKV19878.1 hypothetical protein PDIG_00450 [Penicillium digitatum PHI26]EKV21794.1 hypothetical protein PDIP_02710 [Penicillium digitatum Pd1]KAG0154658.1 hypothetical protein PDIDSM_226 [Penicillium digitatum]QQK47654.1 LPS-induced tumor necrosis factor alpha factor [Penicillium digitatum]